MEKTTLVETTDDNKVEHLNHLDIIKALGDLSNPLRVVEDVNELSKRVEPSTFTTEEINELSAKLWVYLELYGGVGLSANQLGIDKRICVINVKEPIVLVNPEIVSYDEKWVVYSEGCISIPKTLRKPKNTRRAIGVTVKTDNLGEVVFSSDKKEYKTFDDLRGDMGLLEAVVVQHEIDHLNGILITDKRRIYNSQIRVEKKYGRNERVMIKSADGTDSMFVKYKDALPLIEKNGYVLQ